MKKNMDIDALLAPIPGENPSGEDLRYTRVYDDIKEARRADDPFAMGEWQREIKTSDWDMVFSLCIEALLEKSKDLQISAWLNESLIMIEGFSGLEKGLGVMAGFLDKFWETVYPEVDDGDMEYRIAPFEFLNDKLSSAVRQVPLTDPGSTPGYSLLKWQESREVGSEADTKNKYGDIDEQKKARRDELLADGKIPAEDFDAAVARSSATFYRALSGDISSCIEAFKTLDALVDKKFGNDAPRISDLGQAIEECGRLLTRIFRDQKRSPDGIVAEPPESALEQQAVQEIAEPQQEPETVVPDMPVVSDRATSPSVFPSMAQPAGSLPAQEEALWNEALGIMKAGGLKQALDLLLSASNSRQSERERNRYRFLVAKLCIKAGRPDLARPIMEQLNTLIGELKLDQWESPLWIAEVLEALYRCLTSAENSDDDMSQANDLFRKICTLDVTQAIAYRK